MIALSTLFVVCLAAASPLVASPESIEQPRSLDARLTIELVAAEPSIVTPTGLAVDAKGRVLVVESHTHFRPEDYAGPHYDRIRCFTDTNGDGRPDHVETVYEGGEATMNVAALPDGSLLVARRSEIFRLEDTTADGRFDRQHPLAQLVTSGNYPHNGLSGFALDPLGWVYFGLGENLGAPYELVGADGRRLAGGGEGGSIYRIRADGTRLQRVATGFWNPFHLAWDALGRLWAVDNDPDSRPPCRLLHIVPAGDYGYRYRNGRQGIHPFTAWDGELPGTLPMAAGTGEAPSGIVSYDSHQFPDDYRGTLLVTSWGDHRIECYRPQPRGASWQAVGAHVVEGGESFRPVGIALAPDGSLYVSDWVDRSYQLHGKGRVWRIRASASYAAEAAPVGTSQTSAASDAPRRGRPAATRADEPSAPTETLRHRAAHDHRPLREAAAARLAAGTDADRQHLTDLLANDPRIDVRATALLALIAAQRATGADAAAVLDSAEPTLRALAVRELPPHLVNLGQVAEHDADSAVRAAALARLTRPAARPLLLAQLVEPDPFLRHAAVQGLRQSSTLDGWLAWSRHEQPQIRLAALLLLRDSRDPRAVAALPALLDDADLTNRLAAIGWVADARLEAFRPQLSAALQSPETPRSALEAVLAALERLDGVERAASNEWAGDSYLAQLALDERRPAAVRARALAMLPPDHAALLPRTIELLIAHDDAALRLEAVRTLVHHPHPDRTALLVAVAADARQSDDLRAEAVLGLAPHDTASLELLLALACGDNAALAAEALRSLRGAELSLEVRAQLEPLVADRNSPLAAAALRVLEPQRQTEFPPVDDLDSWLALAGSASSDARFVAAGDTSSDARFVAAGDAAAGRRIFFHPRGPRCGQCHQVDGRGGRVGPDLTHLAAQQQPRRIVESLVDPSREIAPQFTAWVVVGRDGRVTTGVLLEETPGGQQRYADVEGREFSWHASQIEARDPLRLSLMPQDLPETLTEGEFRDLVAFLLSLE